MNAKKIKIMAVLVTAILNVSNGPTADAAEFSFPWTDHAETRDADFNGIAETLDRGSASVVGNASWSVAEYRTVLEFDVSSLTDPLIESASLELKANWYRWSSDHPDGGVIALYAYLGDGTATTADHGRLDYLAWSGTSDGALTVDVTDALQWVQSSGADYAGFVLDNLSVDDANDRAGRGWYIRPHNGGPSTTYVELSGTTPEPASIVFLVVGAIVSSCRRQAI